MSDVTNESLPPTLSLNRSNAIPDLMKSLTPKRTNAEDLKCGDMFMFRGVMYLCLLNFTDMRHTQSIITCVDQNLTAELPLKVVTALRLFRTFMVDVYHRFPIQVRVINHTDHELQDLPHPSIESD